MRGGATLAALVALAMVATSCTTDSSGDEDATADEDAASTVTDTEGFADAEWFASRRADYLAFATEELDPTNIISVLAHATRAERDDGFTFDATAVTPETLAEPLDKITGWVDTSDFDLLYLLNLWYGHRDQLTDELNAAIEDAVLGYEYWFTEPTPPDVVDNKYYWSENHRIIFAVCEYLAGQAFPDATFTNDGSTGAEHREDARRRIDDWLDEKARFGFSEWHSDVYYQKDVTPLLTFIEWAEGDDELTTRAAMVLDVVLFDLALHLHDGNFGATHGRSYMKDKSVATDQDTFGLAKLLFDDTELPYPSRADSGATVLAASERYRLPEVVRRVAASEEPMVDRERMGVPLDPLAPVTDDPEAPYGYDFDDPANLAFWWERGAQTAWQVVPLTLETLERYDLWSSKFFSPFEPLRDTVSDDPEAAQQLAQSLAPTLSFGLLSEASTVTYRTAEVMLSTVLDHRPGTYGDQHHVWQATLGPDAVVFTTHPKNEPFVGEDSWPDDDGYWTGTGSLPRSAQHGAASVHLYAPRNPAAGLLGTFGHLPFTHAWFPTGRFDEVVRDGHWTFGRSGDGYVGLWSHREPDWRTHDPAEVFTDGLTEPFDLVAEGGPDNVWIAEVGDAATAGGFEDFQAALTSAEITVEPRPPTAEGYPGGFDVRYASPAEGVLELGQDGPFTVDGEEVPLRNEARFDNPWAQVANDSDRYEIADEEGGLTLDFAAGTREVHSAG